MWIAPSVLWRRKKEAVEGMGQLVRAVAAGKRSKEIFKTLKHVTVTINPFDHRSTTARCVRIDTLLYLVTNTNSNAVSYSFLGDAGSFCEGCGRRP